MASENLPFPPDPLFADRRLPLAEDLATCSYGEWRASMGALVQTSLGTPKWLDRWIATNLWAATPRYAYMRAPEDEYLKAYMAQLDRHGVEEIRDTLSLIREKTGSPRLVLACYEKLSTGKWCHRRLFATWWAEKTGLLIPELGQMTAPPAVSPDTPLF